MMQQYLDAKAAHPDSLLLFRMGDFYELFHDDAKLAAKVLGLTLTSRDKGENPVPMAGFPFHQLESYLGKLIANGIRAAICEQVEDPKQAKGIVRREVVRVVTPGTVTDDALLDPRSSNYLAAFAPGDEAGLAWIDLSTGRFFAARFPASRIPDELARIQPSECLLPEGTPWPRSEEPNGPMITYRPAWIFGKDQADQLLQKHFGVAGLGGFGFDEHDGPAIRAAGAILEYLAETQKATVAHVDRLVHYTAGSVLEIDEASRRSLEILRTARDGKREGSLLATMDRTISAMGSRLLADWLASPLTGVSAIEFRQAAVEDLIRAPNVVAELRLLLSDVYDLERLIARVTTQRASPRDLGQIGRTLSKLPAFLPQLANHHSELLVALSSSLDMCEDLAARLNAALVDDCPLAAREGGIIRSGFHPQVDELRELATGGKQWIARYQAEQQQETGIPSLKVNFNKVFGYYIEITHTHRERIPDNYIRRQTVKNAERYITPELKEYEDKVLSADQRSMELEYELFVGLRDLVAANAARLQATAAKLAQIDVLSSLADLARSRGYCRPRITEEPVLDIVDGRHPVLDFTIADGSFVPNDVQMGGDAGKIMLITGPNMAGKSTYIRQLALLTVMAQIGSFVPARQATIGIADRVFARVGASDELARGQSTFMVEMTESARILNTATPRSLVILDEIGRGTSTYDGLSLAWSVVEYLHESIGCRTLFATHYHELTALAKDFVGVENFNVAVKEWNEQVIFLHKIVPGTADRSYGIHVARLAGVPVPVIERAKTILAELENSRLDQDGHARAAAPTAKSSKSGAQQRSLFAEPTEPLADDLRLLRLDEMTPLAAMNWMASWQQRVNGRDRQ
jgi:DNA mismatch repair protein MutS